MATVIMEAQLGETIGNNSWGYIKVSDGLVYKANAAAAASQAAFFINVGNTSGNYVQIIYSGEMDLPSAGLTVGAYYFLDPATPGAHTITQGTGAYQQLFKAIDTDRILIDIKAAVPAVGGGGSSDSLGTGFTSGGGSGTIPDGTAAEADGVFEIQYNTNTNASEFSLKNDIVLSNGQADDFLGFISPDESVVAGVGRWIADENELCFMAFAALGSRQSEFIQSPYLFQIAARTDDFTQNGLLNVSPTAITLSVDTGTSTSLSDATALAYGSDYSSVVITNDRSIPDVGTVKQLATKVYSGTKTATGTATTTFTVTIGVTMASAGYKVTVTAGNALSSAVHYVNNKTTTTFDVVFLAGLTGSVAFDWMLTV